MYIKQYWYFQIFPSKLNYSKNFFPEFISQNTNTLKKLVSHNIDLFRARISNSIHTLTYTLCYYQTIVNKFLRVSTNTWTDRIYQTENSQVTVKTLAYTHETDNVAFKYSWVWMIHQWWLYGSKWPSPSSPKKEIKSPRCNFPSP